MKVFDFASSKKIVAITLILNNNHLRYYTEEKHNLASLLVRVPDNILKTLNSENDLQQAISLLELVNNELTKTEVSEENIL
ncbi:KRAB-A domain-containing protein 2-like [Aphis craccivora]|uniref:KRAB-A domain-containing protein 2-like n=1 Tax=Aphis craccivora TaxID=307492 RepID=A0A6G0Y126_APHCR|nr:KRAB-A domain-containing protein 2-like [Aphis craccivora]